MIQYAAILMMMIGLYGLFINRHVMKIIVSLNVLELGLNLFIISIGYVTGGIAPIMTSTNATSALLYVDPLPQALVLTSIVIGVGTTALGLAIARKIYETYGTLDLERLEDK
jgi:multicomponent Na+:H+ antiporter subunit C